MIGKIESRYALFRILLSMNDDLIKEFVLSIIHTLIDYSNLGCPVERSECRVKEVLLDPGPAGRTGPELDGVRGDGEVHHPRGEAHGEGDGDEVAASHRQHRYHNRWGVKYRKCIKLA